MRTGAVGTMAIESRPMSFMSARRRRVNSSRAILPGGTRLAAVDERLRRVLMNGRGAGRRLLAAGGCEFDEQHLHANADEFDHFRESGFVLLVLIPRIDTHVRDLGEVADDLAGFGGHLG